MKAFPTAHNLVVAALAGALAFAGPAPAIAQAYGPGGADRLEELMDRLADPDTGNWEIVEQEILQRWSISGSASADLLLNLGAQAMEAGEFPRAIAHLTALVDHAPEFAEAWNARATAYYRAGLVGPALYDIEEALRRNPRHFGALTGLGIILQELGETERALAAFRAAQEINPHRPDISAAIARIEAETEGEAL